MIDWAYLGVFFAFFVLPLLVVWFAIKYRESKRR
jgi:hypothetical protein